MISQTSVLPPSQELEEFSDPNGPNDLIYQASIGSGSVAAEHKAVSLRIEPNSSISRLRSKASFAEPVYLEIQGVLIPRALKTNGLLSVSVHCDANNQLLAHALRRHVLSLVLRRKTGWLNDVLAWLRLQDSDEVLRCTERPTELLHASSHWNVGRDGLDVRISLTNDWPLDKQVCNLLPEGLGLPANPGLPLHGCHVVRSMANTPLGYMMLPVHPSPPLGFETWAEPLRLRYKRRETVDDLPARDCLIDWLDEAIHVETELEEYASERRGYADWLSSGQSDAIYEFLKPEAHFACRENDVTSQRELVLSERIGSEVIETVIKPNKSFRLGPLLCRLRSV